MKPIDLAVTIDRPVPAAQTPVPTAPAPGRMINFEVPGTSLGAGPVVLDVEATIVVAQRESERSRLAHWLRSGAYFCRMG